MASVSELVVSIPALDGLFQLDSIMFVLYTRHMIDKQTRQSK